MLLNVKITNRTLDPIVISQTHEKLLLLNQDPPEDATWVSFQNTIKPGQAIKAWQEFSYLTHVEPKEPRDLFQVQVMYDATLDVDHPIYDIIPVEFKTITSFVKYLYFHEIPFTQVVEPDISGVHAEFLELGPFIEKTFDYLPIEIDPNKIEMQILPYRVNIIKGNKELLPLEVILPNFDWTINSSKNFEIWADINTTILSKYSGWDDYVSGSETFDGFYMFMVCFLLKIPLGVPQLPVLKYFTVLPFVFLGNPEEPPKELLLAPVKKGFFPDPIIIQSVGRKNLFYIPKTSAPITIKHINTDIPYYTRLFPFVVDPTSGDLNNRILTIYLDITQGQPTGDFPLDLTYTKDGTEFVETTIIKIQSVSLPEAEFSFRLRPIQPAVIDHFERKINTLSKTTEILIDFINSSIIDGTGTLWIHPKPLSVKFQKDPLDITTSNDFIGYTFDLTGGELAILNAIFQSSGDLLISLDPDKERAVKYTLVKEDREIHVILPGKTLPTREGEVLFLSGQPKIPITFSFQVDLPIDITVLGEGFRYQIEKRESNTGEIKPSFYFEEEGQYDATIVLNYKFNESIARDLTIQFTISRDLFSDKVELDDRNFFVRDGEFHVALKKYNPKLINVPLINNSRYPVRIKDIYPVTSRSSLLHVSIPDLPFPILLPPGSTLMVPVEITSYQYGRSIFYLQVETDPGFPSMIPISTFTNAGPNEVYVYPLTKDVPLPGITGSVSRSNILLINFGSDPCYFRGEILGYDSKEFSIPENGYIPGKFIQQIPISFVPFSSGPQIAYAHIKLDSMVNYFRLYTDLTSMEVKLQQARTLHRIDAVSKPQEATPKFLREIIDFGFVPPGGKRIETIDIENLGLNPFVILNITYSSPNIKILHPKLPFKVGDKISIPIVVRAPTTPGEHIDVVVFDIQDAITKRSMTFHIPIITRVSEVPELFVQVNSKEIDFGYSEINHPKEDTLILRNLSNETISVRIEEVDDTEGVFQFPTFSFSLPPANSFKLPLVFIPHRVAKYTGNLTITINDEDFYITLKGEGVDYNSPLIKIVKRSWDVLQR